MNGPAGSAGGCKTDETGRRFHPCGSAGAKSKLVHIHAPGNAGSEPLSPPVAAHAPGKRPSAPLSVSHTQSVATIRRAGTPPRRPLPSGRAFGKSPPVPVLQSYVLSVRENSTIAAPIEKKLSKTCQTAFITIDTPVFYCRSPVSAAARASASAASFAACSCAASASLSPAFSAAALAS